MNKGDSSARVMFCGRGVGTLGSQAALASMAALTN